MNKVEMFAEIYQDQDVLGEGKFYTTTYVTHPTRDGKVWIQNDLKPMDTAEEARAQVVATYPFVTVEVV
jgi:hypothetical protein